MKEFGNRPLENITFDEVEQVLVKNNTNVLREVSNTISIRKSAKGDYIFYKLPKMKKPSCFSLTGFDHDFATCEIELIKTWVKTKYNIF